jgi:hypothetical protein
MATCPKCGGYLSDDHRCFGAWRHIARTMGAALIGALFGVIAVSTLADRPTNLLLGVAGLLGAVLVGALWHESKFY